MNTIDSILKIQIPLQIRPAINHYKTVTDNAAPAIPGRRAGNRRTLTQTIVMELGGSPLFPVGSAFRQKAAVMGQRGLRRGKGREIPGPNTKTKPFSDFKNKLSSHRPKPQYNHDHDNDIILLLYNIKLIN